MHKRFSGSSRKGMDKSHENHSNNSLELQLHFAHSRGLPRYLCSELIDSQNWVEIGKIGHLGIDDVISDRSRDRNVQKIFHFTSNNRPDPKLHFELFGSILRCPYSELLDSQSLCNIKKNCLYRFSIQIAEPRAGLRTCVENLSQSLKEQN